MIDTLRQTLDSVNACSKRNEELVEKLSAQIEAYQKQIRNLEDRNQRHNKNTFDQKTHKAKKRVDERRGREAIYGNNDLEALLLPAIATK